MNTIAAISSNSLLAFDHALTVDHFYGFVRGSLVPHSIAVMDNCSIQHHVNEVRELFRNAGILLLF